MKILRNHILSEFFQPFIGTVGTLVFMFFAGRGFVQMADLVFNKQVDVILILKLLFYSFPFTMTFVIPMAVLIATLLTFGKLSYDNEIMAMRASGVGLKVITIPLIIATVVLCLFSYLLSDQIASASHFAYRRLLTQIGIESPQAALEEGTFIKKFKNFVIFIYEIDKNKLKGIRIYQPQEGKPTRTIMAQKGELISIPEKNIIKLRLVHGTSDEPDPKDPAKLYKLNFKTYDLPLNVDALKDYENIAKKPKDMSVKELREEIKRLKEEGIDDIYSLVAEIHHKIALAGASLAFLLIGIPLGITTRRTEKSISIGISLSLMLLYWALLISGKALAQKNIVPAFLAMQFPNFLVGGIGFYLFIRMVKR